MGGLFDSVTGRTWRTSEDDIEDIIQTYFTDLFASSRLTVAVIQDVLNSV